MELNEPDRTRLTKALTVLQRVLGEAAGDVMGPLGPLGNLRQMLSTGDATTAAQIAMQTLDIMDKRAEDMCGALAEIREVVSSYSRPQ